MSLKELDALIAAIADKITGKDLLRLCYAKAQKDAPSPNSVNSAGFIREIEIVLDAQLQDMRNMRKELEELRAKIGATPT